MGGLINAQGLYPFSYRGYIGNADSQNQTGFYRGTSDNTNTPSSLTYGLMLVISSEGYIYQQFIDTTYEKIYFRISINNGSSWKDWRIFQL